MTEVRPRGTTEVMVANRDPLDAKPKKTWGVYSSVKLEELLEKRAEKKGYSKNEYVVALLISGIRLEEAAEIAAGSKPTLPKPT